ncbi:hypothetical protein C347_06485 [Cryptococcus neoformans AD2-60a]|uniref:Ribosome biogenesis regulatory protein n=2 Tax=Cryptococcus neoformans TaxID=5207 RepID=A0A854Q1R8_CRYNE|nr:hypothetical protein CNAG_06273 [Cryptococcus neoformans var. grubii H99]AUB28663.1 hypothetical protein CKF44_06273 [Cryptococcus neoformans var. grubii]OWZ26838.1 hypothetical protein C347_06485 [Cryptococcus neoformans var. grubii AD2-60a]OWZ50171.1 hypothetical protein C368_06306 [Cryptococcus neoformans var. grubii 125.91]OXC81389.1 hypothetical protein C344_06390 [Cryptococcus neoformans var. grubii AD1-7a]OXG10653.1 hypothetical protein C361_06685 [Cryptococcus neoformans var. grubii|eukprot:XP_012053372.1 hypothetical protein CNAG_06273 [Cryptococcus neoformans var. grubii H99]
MDVSHVLDEYTAASTTAVLPRAAAVQTDPALLAAFDVSPPDPAAYADRERHLLQLTLTSTHALLAALFALPTTPSPAGPVTAFPPPATLLPREKPLPKPKPLTKWERFAKEKGISHKTREKDVWDEDRQEWVPRWGRFGKNKDKEAQWLHEVKPGDEADQDPGKTARGERKARIAKNTKQHSANLATAAASVSAARATAASERAARKEELNRNMLISKTSTASLGKFDNKIDGEPKARGMKRKFDANIPGGSEGTEKERQLSVLKRVERGETNKAKRGGQGVEGGLNVRKALRFSGDGGKARPKTTGKKGKRK